jgi:hypothetical protein
MNAVNAFGGGRNLEREYAAFGKEHGLGEPELTRGAS